MKYFKILPCRNFVWNNEKFRSERWIKRKIFRLKIGVWHMPLFKFLRTETWRWNLWFDRPKRLKYKVHQFFTLKCHECSWCKYECKTAKTIRPGERNNKRIPKFVKEKDPTLLGDNVSFTGGKGRLLSHWFKTIA